MRVAATDSQPVRDFAAGGIQKDICTMRRFVFVLAATAFLVAGLGSASGEAVADHLGPDPGFEQCYDSGLSLRFIDGAFYCVLYDEITVTASYGLAAYLRYGSDPC